jgi:hypothetical protein
VVLIIAAWTAVFAVALRQDPHAASDSALLLAKSAYADGNQYVPNLFVRSWKDAAPGLGARIVVWLFLLVAVAAWCRRVVQSGGGSGRSPLRALASVAGLLLAAGFLLERAAPPVRPAPRFPDAMAAGPDAIVFVSGAAVVREDEAIVGPGPIGLLVRAPVASTSLKVTVGGQGGVLRAADLPPLVLRPTGALIDLPLRAYHEIRGRDGRNAFFTRAVLDVEGEAVLRPGDVTVVVPPPRPPPSAPEGDTEPGEGVL